MDKELTVYTTEDKSDLDFVKTCLNTMREHNVTFLRVDYNLPDGNSIELELSLIGYTKDGVKYEM